MKIEQLLNEHKKGVKAIKYAKKPQPLVGPEAQKKKAKAKVAPPKTELEKHSKLATKLEGVAEGSAGAKYKIKSIGKDKNGDYYISPNTGKKVYKQAKVGDHETPRGEVKSKVAEGSAQEKLYQRHQELRKKSGLPDPEYYKELKTTFDLPDEERQTKTKELKKKYNVKEAKRPDRPPPKTDLKVGDDVVADTSKEDYPGGHKERRGKVTRVGQQGVHIKTDDSDEPEWHPYKIVKKSEKSMKEAKQPEAPKPRNFVAKNAKTAGAGKHKDAKKAMKDVRGQKHKNKEMAEMSMGKVVDYKPGVSATIDTGPGMTTQLDLKKNPTSLTKDPQTGKLKLVPNTGATAQPSATTQSTVKPGDQVEMPKTNTQAAEDILRLAGLR